jgi:hypothetical protein
MVSVFLEDGSSKTVEDGASGLDLAKAISTSLAKKAIALEINGVVKDLGTPIQDGDKVRFAYLKLPNPIQNSVIATPDELPAEFNLDKYIDRDMQFDKAFLEPVRSITSIIGWEVEQKSTLESFFS